MRCPVNSPVVDGRSILWRLAISCSIPTFAAIAFLCTAGCTDHGQPEGFGTKGQPIDAAAESGVPLGKRSVDTTVVGGDWFKRPSASTAPDPYVSSRARLQLAPDIELDLLDGGRFSLKQHRAQDIVIIDFWASWCSPCVEELPVVAAVAAEFREKNVVLCTVNVGEDAATIRQFLANRDLQLTVARDPSERVADAYGAVTLPTLVLIDQKGFIQRVHAGYHPDLGSTLRSELKTLVAGGSLSGSSPPALTGITSRAESRRHRAETYRLALPSGRELDVGAILRAETSDYQERIDGLSDAGRLLRLKYPNGKTSMLIGRQASGLHGPTAAYYQDGDPMVYLTYNRGKRDKALFSWDENKRPLIFEQYESGKRHGLCCLFQACSEQCSEGHLWLVEEWLRGKLLRTHLVADDGAPFTIENTANESAPQNDTLETARAQIKEFHAELSMSEKQLRQSVIQLRKHEKQIIAARKRAARQWLMAALAQRQSQMVSQFRPSSRLRVCRTGGG